MAVDWMIMALVVLCLILVRRYGPQLHRGYRRYLAQRLHNQCGLAMTITGDDYTDKQAGYMCLMTDVANQHKRQAQVRLILRQLEMIGGDADGRDVAAARQELETKESAYDCLYQAGKFMGLSYPDCLSANGIQHDRD